MGGCQGGDTCAPLDDGKRAACGAIGRLLYQRSDHRGVVKGGGTWWPLDLTRPIFTKGCKKQGFGAKQLVNTSKNIVKYKVLCRFGLKVPSKKASK